MAELEECGRKAGTAEMTALPYALKGQRKEGTKSGVCLSGHTKVRRSTSRPEGSKEMYAHCDSTGHGGDSCWKKHPERVPAWRKKRRVQ